MFSSVILSNNDRKRGVSLPERMTPILAEDIGIMVGDGTINKAPCGNNEVSVFGHRITDNAFLTSFVKQMKKTLFNINCKIVDRPSINTCVLRYYSLGILRFYTQVIGLPSGRKDNISVPNCIMNGTGEIKRAFLRGLADTDMTLTFKRTHKNILHYPVIKLGTASKNLVLETKKLLEEVGFSPNICCDIRVSDKRVMRPYFSHQLNISGKKQLQKWVRDIGFHNPKNVLRYVFWKKNGYSLRNDDIERIMSGPDEIRIRGRGMRTPTLSRHPG